MNIQVSELTARELPALVKEYRALAVKSAKSTLDFHERNRLEDVKSELVVYAISFAESIQKQARREAA